MDELLKWLLTVGSASIAAYIGSIVALKKFKKEKIWTQKQEAYLCIIEALHNLILWADEEYAYHFPGGLPSVGKEKLLELRVKQFKSIDTLRKYVHLGGLVLSKDVSKKLEKLLKEYHGEEMRFYDDPSGYNDPEDISDHFFKIREIVEKHIEDVKRIAKLELNL